MQLTDLKIGQSAQITSLAGGDKVYRQRLIALGLLPGTPLTLTHIAPLGDPIELQVRGFSLSLRKSEASIINIETIV
jgi:ferrous iron transport protein A